LRAAAALLALAACTRPPPDLASRTSIEDAASRDPGKDAAIGDVAAPSASASRGDEVDVRARYDVVYDGEGTLDVEARFATAADRLVVERGAERFVREARVVTDGGLRPLGRRDGAFTGCAAAPCRIRYRYALREACRAIDRVTTASEEGDVLVAPPSTWLLAPEHATGSLRFEVRARAGTFVSGAPGAIAFADLWTAPYAAFGPLTVRRVSAGAETITLARTPGRLRLDDDALGRYVARAADAVSRYFGRFPLNEVLVLVVPSRGRWMGEGRTLAGGGAGIFLRIGEDAPPAAYAADWVLVHEMVHLAFPSLPREQDWAEEGLATYVEPIARARAGLLPPERAWRDLWDGLPNGLPGPGDRGLDHTRTWGRTYWGGALFYLLADIAIRSQTNRRLGLEHALRGILARGGNNGQRWSLAAALRAGDDAIGRPVLTDLHAKMGAAPSPVDLDALFRSLGIERAGAGLRFVDAPLAGVRDAILPP